MKAENKCSHLWTTYTEIRKNWYFFGKKKVKYHKCIDCGIEGKCKPVLEGSGFESYGSPYYCSVCGERY